MIAREILSCETTVSMYAKELVIFVLKINDTCRH